MAIRIRRRSKVSWQGNVEEGGGRIALGSGAYEGPLTLKARVEDVERSSNPEELIAAAHAGCFTMSLANQLSSEGHPPNDLQTTAMVQLEQQEQGFSITQIKLTTVGDVPGVDEAQFEELANRAKQTCPVSRALAGTEIVLEAKLAES
ncbi:MAG: OsmC family peroxiredoxin [Solirubrobacterales bacterium]|nr:OsmC family peroxiredoxin [Solirubrobacterales bacterium]